MDELVAEQYPVTAASGGGRRIRLRAECKKCRSLISLDQVFERILGMIGSQQQSLARIERTLYGEGVATQEQAQEPAPEG
jgi:hypothetical protein